MPWGIELEHTLAHHGREIVRASLGLTTESLVLFTRNLEPIYAVETLMEAFRLLLASNLRVVLALASNGSLRPWVEGFINQHKLNGKVLLIGAVHHDRLMDLFAAADCYVSCAASDGTSISLLEAMAFGLPVIVTDLGGNPQWVHPNANGWLAPLNDSSSFARHMYEAITLTPEKRQFMAQNNKDLIRTKADWGCNFSRLMRHLGSIVDRVVSVERHEL